MTAQCSHITLQSPLPPHPPPPLGVGASGPGPPEHPAPAGPCCPRPRACLTRLNVPPIYPRAPHVRRADPAPTLRLPDYPAGRPHPPPAVLPGGKPSTPHPAGPPEPPGETPVSRPPRWAPGPCCSGRSRSPAYLAPRAARAPTTPAQPASRGRAPPLPIAANPPPPNPLLLPPGKPNTPPPPPRCLSFLLPRGKSPSPPPPPHFCYRTRCTAPTCTCWPAATAPLPSPLAPARARRLTRG